MNLQDNVGGIDNVLDSKKSYTVPELRVLNFLSTEGKTAIGPETHSPFSGGYGSS